MPNKGKRTQANDSPTREEFERREREPGTPKSAGRANSMQPEGERDFADAPVEPGAHEGGSRSVHIVEPRKKKRIV